MSPLSVCMLVLRGMKKNLLFLCINTNLSTVLKHIAIFLLHYILLEAGVGWGEKNLRKLFGGSHN